jgi:hypothetical protein
MTVDFGFTLKFQAMALPSSNSAVAVSISFLRWKAIVL